MKDKFTKADLKDGMIVEVGDKCRFVFWGNRLLSIKSYDTIETYDNYLENPLSDKCTAQKVYQIKKDSVYCLKDIFEDENLELIWERKETKRMTAEEMKTKLEELTGERIEIIPSRWEMVEEINCYCEDLDKCDDCMIKKECDSRGNFDCWSNNQLRECYEMVMNDGRKEI